MSKGSEVVQLVAAVASGAPDTTRGPPGWLRDSSAPSCISSGISLRDDPTTSKQPDLCQRPGYSVHLHQEHPSNTPHSAHTWGGVMALEDGTDNVAIRKISKLFQNPTNFMLYNTLYLCKKLYFHVERAKNCKLLESLKSTTSILIILLAPLKDILEALSDHFPRFLIL